jgi:hypothetical protein
VTTRPVLLTRNVSSKTGTKKISPIPGRRITLEKESTRRLPGRSGMMSVVGNLRDAIPVNRGALDWILDTAHSEMSPCGVDYAKRSCT